MASRVEDVLQMGPDKAEGVMKAFDRATRVWRGITLAHPSWITNNVLGNLTLMLSGRVSPKDAAEYMTPILKARWYQNNPEKLAKISMTVAGQKYTGQEIIDLMKSNHAWGEGHSSYLHALSMNPEFNKYAVPSAQPGAFQNMSSDFNGVFSKIGSDFANVKRQATAAKAAGETVVPPAVGAFGTILKDRVNRVWAAPLRRVNNAAEDWMRGVTFASFLNQGNDAESAMRKTLEVMFDYKDLTHFENTTMKRILPFYSWVKNNAGYQARLMVERPAIAAAFPKAREAIEEMMAGDQRVPLNQRPSWMNDSLGIQFGSDPETRRLLTAQSALPVGDAYKLLTPFVGEAGVQDLLHWFVGQTNPIATFLPQVGLGREFFSGRTIGPENKADISSTEFALKQIRPLNELGFGGPGSGPLGKAAEQGPAALAGRVLFGGKSQDFSEERRIRHLTRQFQDEATNVRRAIQRSETAGDKEGSLRKRVDLLNLFRRMQQAGIGDQVPKWAREQLGALAPSE
jgi:hypothetical protein